MKKIIVKENFSANGIDYIVGDEIKPDSYYSIIRLNEKGFIEPLDYKDLVLIKRELEDKDKNKKEEVL